MNSISFEPGKLYSRQPRSTSSRMPHGNCSMNPNPPNDRACIFPRPCRHDLNSRLQFLPGDPSGLLSGTRNGWLLFRLFQWIRGQSTTLDGKCPCWLNFSSHIEPICSYVSAITQNGVSRRGGGVSSTNLQILAIRQLVVPLPLPPVRNKQPSPLLS